MSVGNTLLFNTSVAFFTGLLLQKKWSLCLVPQHCWVIVCNFVILDCFNANLIQGMAVLEGKHEMQLAWSVRAWRCSDLAIQGSSPYGASLETLPLVATSLLLSYHHRWSSQMVVCSCLYPPVKTKQNRSSVQWTSNKRMAVPQGLAHRPWPTSALTVVCRRYDCFVDLSYELLGFGVGYLVYLFSPKCVQWCLPWLSLRCCYHSVLRLTSLKRWRARSKRCSKAYISGWW